MVIALLASGSVFGVEIWASIRTGSLALLADAGHLLVDLSGLLLAYGALRLASRPATPQATYGFVRAEVLAAAFNGLLLVGVALFLVSRAIVRLRTPLEDLDHGLVLLVAIGGLLANVIAALALHRDAGENINTKGAFFNVIGDAVASVGVIASALLVRFTGDPIWDTLVSFFVATIIVAGGVALVRSTGAILLEVAPPDIDMAAVKAKVETLHDVVNVHDLHVWTHTPGHHSTTLHVSIRREAIPRFHHVIRDVEELLRERFGLEHCTIQVEPEGEDHESDRFDPVHGVLSDAEE